MSTKNGSKYEDDMELRRGPWTLEEDTLLIHYIACHGEGRWNQLARCSGLKRTGKSCRLRWLNYLKPDVKRGNLTPEEQILILELHSKWGNRWSRIAQHLPGRTDNEIKNYWRTRVQKQARQLKIDANSAVFRDAVRCFWMPRLLEKMASSPPSAENLNPNYADLLGHTPQEGLFPHTALFSTDLQATFVNSRPCYELSGLENCSPCISSETTMGVVQPADIAQEFSQTPSDAVGNLLLQQYDALLTGHQSNSSCGQAGPGVVAPTPASCSAAVGSLVYDYSALANCGADNTLDSLWSMDELWQARKLENWGI
ncbi:hypothetical protein Taro_033937 [Colocasia esculenta]|uniref:Uncharacterized protein n=1 Tax=Colocasia esculenta TaxID=4460 RepID=A0A843WAG1_COLES|nr:hypothetical protein [Colocasia esculenta]